MLGSKYAKKDSLPFRVYLKHWLFAVRDSHPFSTDILEALSKRTGCKPEACAALPDGCTMYVDADARHHREMAKYMAEEAKCLTQD